jgi:hypothetical protein
MLLPHSNIEIEIQRSNIVQILGVNVINFG